MATAQERTLAQYHGLMRMNASAHVLRAAREIGLIGELRSGQRTAEQLTAALSWQPHSAALLLDALLAIGMIEKYGQDYALSRAGHLLCQYDDDLGDATWARLVSVLRGDETRHDHDDQRQFDYLAATQWSQTAAAMQAAEILDIGPGGEHTGLNVLDLGCGSGVWSCAIAHRDPTTTVTAVDQKLAIEAARATADSIELSDRFTTIVADPIDADVADESFDLVVVAQRTSCLDESATKRLLAKAVAATKAGGRVVVIDLFRGPGKTTLTESIEALRLDLGTRGGRMRTLEEAQADLREAGLSKIQFTFLAASEAGLGMAVGTR